MQQLRNKTGKGGYVQDKRKNLEKGNLRDKNGDEERIPTQ